MEKNYYSKSERLLIKSLGFDKLAQELDAITLYRVMAYNCFINDITGSAAESLRRCCKAINACKINRNTPEWDAMIRIGE